MFFSPSTFSTSTTHFFFYRAFIGGYTTPLVAQLGFCAELTFGSEQSTHSGGQSPRERKQNWESPARRSDEEEESKSSAHVFFGCCGGGGGGTSVQTAGHLGSAGVPEPPAGGGGGGGGASPA